MNRAEKRRQQKLAKKAAAAPRADSPEAHYNRGSALHDKGNLKGAITSYSRAVAIRPDFAAAHYNLGIALKDSGRLDDAVTHFETAAVLLPNVVDAQNNLGTALVELGRPADAVAAYRRSLSLAPDDAGTHFNLGVALKTLEKWDEAAASYRKAVALQPGYADAHYNLMQLFEITNRVEELRDAAVEARRTCSDDPRLALGEAWILKRDGEHAAARQLLEATGRPNEDPVCLAERAYFLGGGCATGPAMSKPPFVISPRAAGTARRSPGDRGWTGPASAAASISSRGASRLTGSPGGRPSTPTMNGPTRFLS